MVQGDASIDWIQLWSRRVKESERDFSVSIVPDRNSDGDRYDSLYGSATSADRSVYGNPETIRLGREALRLISIGFIVSSVSVTVSGALEGAWKREGIVSHFITALYRGDFAAGIYFKPPFSGGWCMARVLDHGICFSSDLMDHMQKEIFQ